MWFFFGILTLLISTLYFGVRRYKSEWKGMPVIVAGKKGSHATNSYKGKTTGILLGCESASDVVLSIKLEKWWDKLFKWLGLIEEYQIGKDYLDKKLFVMSDNPAVCAVIGRSSLIQQALSEIIILCHQQKMKLKGLHMRHGRIWVHLVPDNKKDHATSLSLAYDFIPSLRKIAETYATDLARQISSFRDPTLVKASVILAISTGMAITGAIYLFLLLVTTMPFTVDKTELFKAAFLVATIVVLILAGTAVFYLKNTSRLHLVLIELLTVGYFGAVSCAVVSVRDLNIELNVDPGLEYVANVQSTYISRSRRGGKTYYFYVQDWNTSGVLKIKVYPEIYSQYRNGDKVKVLQHEGAFGFRWVSALEVVR